MLISQYFSDAEATITQHRGIDNTPDESTWAQIFNTAQKMDTVRRFLGVSVIVSSWFRCLKLNRTIGSKDTSQHVKGQAVDFIAPRFGTPLQIVQALAANADLIGFDQLILEHTWVHISFVSDTSRNPRKQVLTLLASKKYALGITYKNGEPINVTA